LRAGSIMLQGTDAAQLKQDTDAIHALCKKGLFELLHPHRLRMRSF